MVAVDPLDGDQVAELVHAIGIELSASSMARLRTRSGGLPFLVEELVTAERDGVTRGIPRRVRDVVRLRLGALSDPAQLVIALVAVAARPMRHRVLQEAAQLSNRVFAAALSEALAANLLVADTAERTYGFRHDVAREIVHEDLLPDQPHRAARSARGGAAVGPSGGCLRQPALRGGAPLAADRR